MPASAARAVFQPTTRLVLRRGAIRSASTTTEAANAASQTASKAKEGASQIASQATSKASEGLSKVQSAGSSVIAKAGPALQGVQNSLGNVGGRTGRVIQAVSSLIPPTIYYSKVALELGKLVAKGQKIQTPNIQQFQTAFQPLANAARNPSQLSQHIPQLSSPQQFLNQARNMSTQQLVTVGVIAAEVLGFFTVGEMLGRFKIVGYRGTPAHELHGGH